MEDSTLGSLATMSLTLDHERLVAVLPMLSERQEQVACLWLKGCSYRRIADELNLSDSTVRGYMRRIIQLSR